MEDLLKHFLREIGATREVKQSFNEYVRVIEENGTDFVSHSLVFPLKYEYSMFTEHFQSLLEFLIVNPIHYEHILRKIILQVVNTRLEKMSWSFRVQLEQIHFVYRFENLPLLEKYKFYPEINMSLSNFACVVAGRGRAKLYTRQTVWHCEKKCTSNVIANDAPKCELCPRTMKECVPLRDVSEHVKLIVYPLEMVQTPRRLGTMHQKFDVILRDDLANFNVIYGSAYVITGLYDWVKKAFYAWNIVEKSDA